MNPLSLKRREWLATTAMGTMSLFQSRFSTIAFAAQSKSPTAINIGSRRELFVDDELIASIGKAILKIHKPEPREVVLTCDAPWEGNTSAYYTLFEDEGRFRIYYRGAHYDEETKKAMHPEFTCYAESRDGIIWTKPKLGVYEFDGTKDNNIVWADTGTHNFAPFKDSNPASPPDGRYKALASGTTTLAGKKKACLNAFQSPDGIHWSKSADAVITDGAFDSQNLAFWDTQRGEYRAYWRFFASGARAIRTATSKDFIIWDNQADLRYVDSPTEHLYTNAVMPYFRAPYLFVGFPTRFQPKTQQVEPVFMSSRDGVLFRRSDDELIPISAPKDRDGNRSNYMTRGLLQLPGDDRELSVYATEAYYAGPASRVRRFTFRIDGFMSLHSASDATVVSKPLLFTGSKLALNIVSRGQTRVEIRAANDKPLPGFALDDCRPITGDFIEHAATWKTSPDLSRYADQPIQLRFELKDADLYSFQFHS